MWHSHKKKQAAINPHGTAKVTRNCAPSSDAVGFSSDWVTACECLDLLCSCVTRKRMGTDSGSVLSHHLSLTNQALDLCSFPGNLSGSLDTLLGFKPLVLCPMWEQEPGARVPIPSTLSLGAHQLCWLGQGSIFILSSVCHFHFTLPSERGGNAYTTPKRLQNFVSPLHLV